MQYNTKPKFVCLKYILNPSQVIHKECFFLSVERAQRLENEKQMAKNKEMNAETKPGSLNSPCKF